MRILFLNQFFWPDTASTGQHLSDLAEYLANAGETVDVICGSAKYGVQNNNVPCPPVSITRLPTTAFSAGIAGRMGSYLSFLTGSLWHGMRHPRPDVVVTLTTPPLLSLVGMMIQQLRGVRHIIWEMDVYPDIAVELGVLRRNSLSSRLFAWLADLPRRRADRVIALGECMRSRLMDHGLPGNNIHVAEIWAECDAAPGGFQHLRPIRSGGLSIVYSGTLGRAHDTDTVAAAMAELDRTDKGIQFTFGGGGAGHKWLRGFCEENGVENAQFLPYCERGELQARLLAGDIGLVTQQANSSGAVLPSKSYGIMAAGRPVLFIGPRQASPALAIQRYGCGWQIDCNDVRGLVELLRHLSEHKELVYAAGERAYQAFVNHYQRSLGVARTAVALRAGAKKETLSVVEIGTESTIRTGTQ